MSLHLLLAGTSTRAAAEAAAQAGFRVTALDNFADLDQHADVRALSVSRQLGHRATPDGLARAAEGLAVDGVAYLSPFENHARAVERLARGRALFGNPPDVLRKVRDPRLVHDELSRRSVPVACVEVESAPRTILKRRASGGGRGARLWQPGISVPRGWFLQRFIEGIPGSVSFVAAHRHCVPIGVSRQLIGDAAFGATAFRYCGSMSGSCSQLFPPADDAALWRAIRALADAVTDAFQLVGLNGIDFIMSNGRPFAIEVNPRWSSSMELFERARPGSLLGAHVGACLRGDLPSAMTAPPPGVMGKAIVFARKRVTMPDTRPWLEDPSVRDVPHAGQQVRTGEPMCTVFAAGDDFEECRRQLVHRASRVYQAVEGEQPRLSVQSIQAPRMEVD
jgi:predicted ATP-grasp superfamily ATP-dependent carboligase